MIIRSKLNHPPALIEMNLLELDDLRCKIFNISN